MTPLAPGFGALKARKLERLLTRELGYAVKPGSSGGSHVKLIADGRPTLTFAFHDSATIGPALVRDILVKQVGLTKDEALEVFQRA